LQLLHNGWPAIEKLIQQQQQRQQQQQSQQPQRQLPAVLATAAAPPVAIAAAGVMSEADRRTKLAQLQQLFEAHVRPYMHQSIELRLQVIARGTTTANNRPGGSTSAQMHANALLSLRQYGKPALQFLEHCKVKHIMPTAAVLKQLQQLVSAVQSAATALSSECQKATAAANINTAAVTIVDDTRRADVTPVVEHKARADSNSSAVMSSNAAKPVIASSVQCSGKRKVQQERADSDSITSTSIDVEVMTTGDVKRVRLNNGSSSVAEPVFKTACSSGTLLTTQVVSIMLLLVVLLSRSSCAKGSCHRHTERSGQLHSMLMLALKLYSYTLYVHEQVLKERATPQ
jgi:hypothetical protein